MSRFSTTAPSTAADDQARARRLPPDLAARTNALLDRLDVLEAQADKQRTATAANARTAHTARTARIRQAIIAMCEQHAPQLQAWSGSSASRARWLQRLIASAIALNNGSWHDLTRPPHIRTITKVINELQM